MTCVIDCSSDVLACLVYVADAVVVVVVVMVVVVVVIIVESWPKGQILVRQRFERMRAWCHDGFIPAQ